MPSLFIPRQSHAHRLACLALYKALLRQCGRLPLGGAPSPWSNPASSRISSPRRLSPLQELVRYRFRRDGRLQSFTAIANALQHGRVQLQVLHEASRGSTAAREALIKTIQATANHAEAEAEARQEQRLHASGPQSGRDDQGSQGSQQTKPAQLTQLQKLQQQHVPPPESVPLTALPLPLSQHKRRRRKVPYLNEAQGRLAILRWPGQHQFPAYLARVMRQKIKRFEKVHEQRMDLEYYVKLGQYEDTWDRIVERQMANEQAGHQQQHQQQDQRRDISWSSTTSDALFAQEALVRKIEVERGARGRFLWSVVKKEQKMSDWETLPERVVHTAKRMTGIHLDLIRVAKRWGKHDLAKRLFSNFQKRRRANIKAAEELTNMYWVIPVEWAKNIQPLTLSNESSSASASATASATTPESRLQYEDRTRTRYRRTPPPSPRQDPTTTKSMPTREYSVHDLKRALDTVKLIDVLDSDGKQWRR